MRVLLDVLAVASAVASFYGAWAAWRERGRARTERQAAQAAAARARALLEGTNVVRLLTESSYRCRRADQAITAGDTLAAVDLLLDLVTAVSRLSVEPTSKGFMTPSAWDRMRNNLTDLASTLRGRGSKPLTLTSRREVSAVLLKVIGELERMAAEAAVQISKSE